MVAANLGLQVWLLHVVNNGKHEFNGTICFSIYVRADMHEIICLIDEGENKGEGYAFICWNCFNPK